MIRNQEGEPVETNVHRYHQDTIEIVLSGPEVVRAFEEWLDSRGIYLFCMPQDAWTSEIPAYAIGLHR